MNKGTARIAVIGCGKVGTALGCCLKKAGWKVVCLYDHAPAAARRARKYIPGAGTVTRLDSVPEEINFFIIAVPDDSIRPVARSLARLPGVGRGAAVLHTCGARGVDELAPLKGTGAQLLAFHPIQTFSNIPRAVTALPGTYYGVTGNRQALALAGKLVRSLKGKKIVLTEQQRKLSHVASVISCNYLSVLLYESVQLYRRAGIPEKKALALQAPLVQATAENAFRNGPVEGLTGPVARGDIDTVRQHLKTLHKNAPALVPLYRSLGREAAEMARKKGTITRHIHRNILSILR